MANAIRDAGFVIVNAHPVKAEMSVATPKFQAKEPIQLDIILVCRKSTGEPTTQASSPAEALDRARTKLQHLAKAGLTVAQVQMNILLNGTTSFLPSMLNKVYDALSVPEPLATQM